MESSERFYFHLCEFASWHLFLDTLIKKERTWYFKAIFSHYSMFVIFLLIQSFEKWKGIYIEPCWILCFSSNHEKLNKRFENKSPIPLFKCKIWPFLFEIKRPIRYKVNRILGIIFILYLVRYPDLPEMRSGFWNLLASHSFAHFSSKK